MRNPSILIVVLVESSSAGQSGRPMDWYNYSYVKVNKFKNALNYSGIKRSAASRKPNGSRLIHPFIVCLFFCPPKTAVFRFISDKSPMQYACENLEHTILHGKVKQVITTKADDDSDRAISVQRAEAHTRPQLEMLISQVGNVLPYHHRRLISSCVRQNF